MEENKKVEKEQTQEGEILSVELLTVVADIIL